MCCFQWQIISRVANTIWRQDILRLNGKVYFDNIHSYFKARHEISWDIPPAHSSSIIELEKSFPFSQEWEMKLISGEFCGEFGWSRNIKIFSRSFNILLFDNQTFATTDRHLNYNVNKISISARWFALFSVVYECFCHVPLSTYC